MYMPYRIVHIYGALVYSAWYKVVPALNSSYGNSSYDRNFSLETGGHITTNFYELKPALDASSGERRCKYGASTNTLGVEVGGALVVFDGKRQNAHPYTQEKT